MIDNAASTELKGKDLRLAAKKALDYFFAKEG